MPTVETNGVQTHYVERGEGPPVVFVHALILRAAQRAPQTTALSDEYRTVAYDVRGHGRTGGSPRRRYSMALFADDLAALLDAEGVEESGGRLWPLDGGRRRADVRRRLPRTARGFRARGHVPGGSAPADGATGDGELRFLARLDRLVSYKALNRWQLRVGNALLPGVGGDEETVQRVVEEGQTIAHAELVKAADATARFQRAALNLSAVTAPALVLHGEHFPAANEAATRRLVRLPNAAPDVRIVPEGGHASNLDSPEFFTRALREFLSERPYSKRARATGGERHRHERTCHSPRPVPPP